MSSGFPPTGNGPVDAPGNPSEWVRRTDSPAKGSQPADPAYATPAVPSHVPSPRVEVRRVGFDELMDSELHEETIDVMTSTSPRRAARASTPQIPEFLPAPIRPKPVGDYENAAKKKAEVGRSSSAELYGRRRAANAEERGRRQKRRRFITLAAVVTVGLAVVAFFAAVIVNPWGPDAQTKPTPVAAGENVPEDLPLRVSQLTVGQCFTTFTSAWQAEFTPISCQQAHAAQLVAVVPTQFADDAEYPGEEALLTHAMMACQSPEALNIGQALGMGDVVIQASYALSQAEWDAGIRDYSCFATRSSGEPMMASLVPVA